MNEKSNHPELNPEQDSVTEESKKRREIVEKIKEFLRENSNEVKQMGFFRIYVFGSTVKGNVHSGSDIDICIITEPERGMPWERQVNRDECVRKNFNISSEFEVITRQKLKD